MDICTYGPVIPMSVEEAKSRQEDYELSRVMWRADHSIISVKDTDTFLDPETMKKQNAIILEDKHVEI